MRQLPFARPSRRLTPSLKALLLGATVAGLTMFIPGGDTSPWSIKAAWADEEPPPPPPPDEDTGFIDEEAPPQPDEAAPPPDEAAELAPLNPGEAIVTRFSHTQEDADPDGKPITIIDLGGTSASIIDIRRPGEPPAGQHWIDEPQRMFVLAAEVGQVFGVALARTGTGSPDIFLTATAAYGLHRSDLGGGDSGWMAGLWGPDSGPGTIFRISEANGYQAAKFAGITLDGRDNTGPSLGNIAYDAAHKRLFVSDLETGMIHSLDVATGKDMGHFDHGVDGRAAFTDAAAGSSMALDPVTFDPASTANIEACPTDFSTTPDCWNIADFRRRIWGLNIHTDEGGAVRLYYSVWGSDAFGNAAWADAGDDRRNSVWSVAITADGLFDTKSVRREFFMPAFWPNENTMGDKAGNSNPVSDITFAQCGPQNVMLVAERGGLRNLGLDKPEAAATPYQSRVIRFELGNDRIWRATGRYDVGFHDRSIKDGQPKAFASAAGGAAFGYGLTPEGGIDTAAPSKSVWMTGDGLCSADGPCTSPATGEHTDSSEVHGIQGTPEGATVPVDQDSTDTRMLDQSHMIDTDINIGADGEVVTGELARNDATMIGDVAVYQVCEAAPPPPVIEEADETGIPPLPPIEPPEDWPVHTLKMSHEKWASTGHRVQRSWHRREGSWHDVDRSWHWKSQSYHARNSSWHWRRGSWHTKARSWHMRGRSLHSKLYSWHAKSSSWHFKSLSYHVKSRTWGGHIKGKSFHLKGKTWGGHVKGRTYHFKGRTWGGHTVGRSYHLKGRTWSGHIKGRTFHVKGRTWGQPGHIKGRSFHVKGQTFGGGGPVHVTGKSFHTKGKTFHVKGKTFGGGGPVHVTGKSFHAKGKTFHVKGKTFGGAGPVHVKGKSFHAKGKTFHVKGKTFGGAGPLHTKGKSFHVKGKTFGGAGPVHVKGKSFHTKGKTYHVKGNTFGGGGLVHVKGKSFHVKGKTFGGVKPVDPSPPILPDRPVHTKKKTNAQQHGKQKSKALQQPKLQPKPKAGQQPKVQPQPEVQQPAVQKQKKKAVPRHFKNRSVHEKGKSTFLPLVQ